MLVIEGVLPFLAPKLWRETFRRLSELADGQIGKGAGILQHKLANALLRGC